MSVDIWPKRGSLKELSLCDIVRSCKAKITFEHKGELCEAIPVHNFKDGSCVICGEEEKDRSISWHSEIINSDEMQHILDLVKHYEDENSKHFDLFMQCQMFIRDNGHTEDFKKYRDAKGYKIYE